MNRLSKLNNYKIHNEDPDIRNWNVILHNMSIGQIKELIIDHDKEKVKFLEVKKEEDYCKNRYMRGRYFLIPIAFIMIDSYKRNISLKTKDPNFLELYPSYDLFFPIDYMDKVKEYIRDYKIKYGWDNQERVNERIRLRKDSSKKSALPFNLRFKTARKIVS